MSIYIGPREALSDTVKTAIKSKVEALATPVMNHDPTEIFCVYMIQILDHLAANHKEAVLGPAGAPGCTTEGRYKLFKEASVAVMKAVRCDICAGYGHHHYECTTSNRVFKKAAADCKVSWVWGAIKGACYYTAYSETAKSVSISGRRNAKMKYKKKK